MMEQEQEVHHETKGEDGGEEYWKQKSREQKWN